MRASSAGVGGSASDAGALRANTGASGFAVPGCAAAGGLPDGTPSIQGAAFGYGGSGGSSGSERVHAEGPGRGAFARFAAAESRLLPPHWATVAAALIVGQRWRALSPEEQAAWEL